MQQTPGQTIGQQVLTPGQVPPPPPGGPAPAQSVLPQGQAPIQQPNAPTSVFQGILQKLNPQNLTPDQQKNLRTLEVMSNKLEKEGRPPDDPAFQNIERKARDVVKGRPGMAVEEITRFEQMYKPQEEAKAPESNEVMLPNGELGNIKGKDAKGLLVESDGHVKKYSEDDVIKPPMPEKDLGDLYEDLVKAIPEEAKSSMINVAGYDPNHNEFIFMPHDGALYVYKDIPQEFADKLQAAMFKAKTTGENLYGAWAEGEESRGAGLSALIKELQKLYGGKGKEYTRKFEKVFDYFELAKKAYKEKHAKRKRK